MPYWLHDWLRGTIADARLDLIIGGLVGLVLLAGLLRGYRHAWRRNRKRRPPK